MSCNLCTDNAQCRGVLTVDDVAAILRVNPATVQRQLKAGALPGNKVGRQWRVHDVDLRQHLKGKS